MISLDKKHFLHQKYKNEINAFFPYKIPIWIFNMKPSLMNIINKTII